MPDGIHTTGAGAVAAFQDLPWPRGTSVSAGPKAGRSARLIPDCTVTFEGGPIVGVEVKKTSTSVSQLRPLDYRPVVVWDGGVGWWVIPADDVVRLSTRYAGQHSTSPLECFNPGKPNAEWAGWKCSRGDVPGRVLAAHQQGESSNLKQLVQRCSGEYQELADRHKDEIRRCDPPTCGPGSGTER